MRLHKAESFFLLLMVLVGLSGYFSFVAHDDAVRFLAVQQTSDPSPISTFSFVATVFSGLAVFCGVFLVYPVIRKGLREQGELQRMAETLSRQSLNLEQAATTDALTGMHNRRYFDDAMVEYLDVFRGMKKPVGMMILDLDRFKTINDSHGHDVGDEVLRRVAQCLTEFTRYHDVVARLGGEEFAVLSPDTNQRQLYTLADRIRTAISEMRVVSGNVTLRVTVSIGLATWDGAESGGALYRRADKHLYEAKRLGRNRVSAA